MKYKMQSSQKEIEESHKTLEQRRNTYKGQGLDFFKNRELILSKTGVLHGNILEIGTGRGVTALSLARLGYKLTSIDTNEEMLKTASLNLTCENLLEKVELYVMDAYKLEFESNSFKNIFMIEALHHMDNAGGLFSEVDRVLTTGGKLILADFNEKGFKILDYVHGKEGHHHENSSLGESEAKAWLTGNGYKIEGYDAACHWFLIAKKK